MKVFISWSGPRSLAVAELLNDWVMCVLQAVRPWLSSRDIDRGALWFSEIHDQLKDTSVGIICLTQENRERPWILFEAGALAKGLSTNRVCTFLIDLKPADLKDPLAQFNHTVPERDSVWALVRTLNNCLTINPLDERILRQVFETYWEQFERGFAQIIAKHPESPTSEPRPREDKVDELLELTRSIQSRLRVVEQSAFNRKSKNSLVFDRFLNTDSDARDDLLDSDERFKDLVAKAMSFRHRGIAEPKLAEFLKMAGATTLEIEYILKSVREKEISSKTRSAKEAP